MVEARLQSQIHRARQIARRHMPATCVIQRPTRVKDTTGGYRPGTPATVSTVPCRVDSAGESGDERLIAGQLDAIVEWAVSLPVGTDVQPSDVIVTGGRTLQIAAVLDLESLAIEQRVLCSEGPG
jgi:hypothetical protein